MQSSRATAAAAAASNPTARPAAAAHTNQQISPLAAYSRSLLDFHRKLWNDARRNSELEARVRQTEPWPTLYAEVMRI